MNRLWLVLAREDPVQLVIQRSDTSCDDDILRDLGQIAAVLARTVKSTHEMVGQLVARRSVAVAIERDARPENGDEPTKLDRPPDLIRVVARFLDVRRARFEHPLLAKDLRIELLEWATRLDPELVDEEPPTLVERLQRVRLAARTDRAPTSAAHAVARATGSRATAPRASGSPRGPAPARVRIRRGPRSPQGGALRACAPRPAQRTQAPSRRAPAHAKARAPREGAATARPEAPRGQSA